MTDGEILSALRKGITSRLGELDCMWAQEVRYVKKNIALTLKALEEMHGEDQQDWEYFVMHDEWRKLEETMMNMRSIHTKVDVLRGVLASIERATAKEVKQ